MGTVPALVAGQALLAGAASAAPVAAGALTAPMTSALAAQLSQNVNQHVIVIFKGQLTQQHVGSHAAAVRAASITTAQKPLLTELTQVHATHVKQYQPINSFAATVSAGEEARLKANPAVAAGHPGRDDQGRASGDALRRRPTADGRRPRQPPHRRPRT